ncbi:Hydrolase, NUDIX family [Alteracholeplasma palmae J233]|uniref:Hydrolase, NUDIX family n=1 Tax=Alteracholeplasma palmae (strain ATCC 49389 / J233) TaxID=1318466 RepID=U4KKY9_ALTPJ|nr:NUDIX domain-containing protein [Alteracholeplasma palmae]CCV64494.1 Hydrolase, NUDIX family [Alteracholeplasma palmae J233]
MTSNILNSYVPTNKQEAEDKEVMIKFLENNEDAFYRTNEKAHFTSSAIILNKDKTKVLFAYHLIFQSWSWLGGHCDGDSDFLRVAQKEALEESNLKNIKLLSEKPLMLDNIQVDDHYKSGKFIKKHIHMNLTYFFEADESEEIAIKPDENSDIKWIKIPDFLTQVREEKMLIIYQKAITVINRLKNKALEG